MIGVISSGCSQIKFAYEYDYRYVFHKIDGLFDLNDQQADLCRQSIKKFHDWHRKSELPKYIECLKEIRSLVAVGFGREQIDQIMSQLDQYKLNAINKLIPPAGSFLTTLSHAQIYKAERKIIKKAIGIEKQRAGARQATIETIEKKVKSRIQYFLGSLTNEQAKMVSEFALTEIEIDKLRVRHRRENHRFFFEQIKRNNTIPANLSLLRQVWIEAYGENDPAYGEIKHTYRNQYGNLIMGVQLSLTDDQKKHLLKQLKNLISDLESLNRK